MKTNSLRMQVAPNLDHISKFDAKEHCCYCDKALYSMRMNAVSHIISVEHDKEQRFNSNQERICKVCDDRLIRKGAQIECGSCDQPIYVIAADRFKEDELKVSDLQGISPQHNPIEGVINSCVHCKQIIEWG